MEEIGPGDSHAWFSPDHQHRSSELWSVDCSNHVRGPVVRAMEGAQTLI